MILHLRPDASREAISTLQRRIEEAGLRTFLQAEADHAALAIVDAVPVALAKELEGEASVLRVIQPRGAYRLVDRAFRSSPTIVRVGQVEVGEGRVVVIAGPCSVETPEIMDEAARAVAQSGAQILRGGAFKPRTSPYAFQGLGVEGLRQLKDAGERYGLPVVSEIMEASDLPAFLDHGIDCLQVGARNMQNFRLLKAVAATERPVLLKRGLSATVDEWLFAAEYLAAGGGHNVILCERGIRTFESATRNTLDLTVLPLLRQWTHLPLLVDPSHAAGIRSLVAPLSRAAIAVGADGVAVEVHPTPEIARCDGPQSLLPGELSGLVAEARVMGAVTGRSWSTPVQAPTTAR